MRWDSQKSSFLLKHRDSMVLSLLIINLVITLIASGSSNPVYVLAEGKRMDSPDLDHFCTSFIDQILARNLQKDMVEPDIYEILVQDNYDVLKLAGHEESLFSRSKKDTCSVVIKDKLGLRRFDLWVNLSEMNPFYYRIRKIDEPAVEG